MTDTEDTGYPLATSTWDDAEYAALQGVIASGRFTMGPLVAEFARLRTIAADNGLVLLEDNCESLGAVHDGINAGTAGVMGTFSAFFSHHISTMEGGLIATDDEHLADMLVSLRAHGWTRELPAHNFVHDKSGELFDDLFRFVLPGYNVRPLEMSGALGIEQLKKVPGLIAGRRANAELFRQAFEGESRVRRQRETGQSSWFGFSLVFEEGLAGRRSEIVAALGRADIDCRPIVAGNFTRNPVMRHLDAIVPESLPAADKIHVDGLFVGNHHYPIPDQIGRLRDTIASLA